MAALLIIDDDEALTGLLSEYLAPQGYDITVASDGVQGLSLATGPQHFDLILLDVMMPKMDGFEVLKRLRISHLTPVLMLTAKGDDFERVMGLELGADDYLAKPFNHRELSARIKAIVRRMEYLPNARVQQALNIEHLSLNPAQQSASYGGQTLSLTGTEFAILHLLMINVGSVVSKEDISQKVLGRRLQAFDRSIDMHVSNLRKKLTEQQCPDLIKTIRGNGYILHGAQ